MQSKPLFRPEDYRNQLGLLRLTSTEIERQISTYTLSFIPVRDEKVEWGMELPKFVPAFYNYIYKNKGIPTQQQFFDYYLQLNHNHFSSADYSQAILTGLKARVFRTYPSLVRDFHFNKYLTERASEYEVFYNSKLDIEHDIDTLLIRDNNYWAACLYTQTARANNARIIKEDRHVRFSNVRYLEFPVPMDDEGKCGDFFLYGERELNRLLEMIQATPQA